MDDFRSSLSRPCPDVVARSLTPSLYRSQRRRFMPEMPSPRSVNNTSSWIWCRFVILSVSSPNDPQGLNDHQIVYKVKPHQLVKYHAVIIYDEKIVRIPFGNEILIVHGDGSNNKYVSRFNIISCTKTHKYFMKGCHVFLAHVSTKKAEDKSKEQRLEDVPTIRDFLEVFPKDLNRSYLCAYILPICILHPTGVWTKRPPMRFGLDTGRGENLLLDDTYGVFSLDSEMPLTARVK
ncbi:hypothetical protein Tco_0974282 [Tanacetum coccineum]|uniref:Reverse transcriptase domain-containing protein n=1 Tax=Tanacetum coccineum TaxID=301880 RepID=A0ABQ5EB49_9ASTR